MASCSRLDEMPTDGFDGIHEMPLLTAATCYMVTFDTKEFKHQKR